jgi:hypothetical protein
MDHIGAVNSHYGKDANISIVPAGRNTSIIRGFFLWWPILGMSMVEINVSKLLEFFQASYRELLHLFSQS